MKNCCMIINANYCSIPVCPRNCVGLVYRARPFLARKTVSGLLWVSSVIHVLTFALIIQMYPFFISSNDCLYKINTAQTKSMLQYYLIVSPGHFQFFNVENWCINSEEKSTVVQVYTGGRGIQQNANRVIVSTIHIIGFVPKELCTALTHATIMS